MIAFMREVSPRLDRCELTHVPRSPIDVKLACKQHAQYAEVLDELGVKVEFLPALPEHPDGVFVEDAAVPLPEVVIIAQPGAASRIAELDSVVQTLARRRPLQSIVDAGTLDGGDVLRVGRTLFVGESQRTNADGIRQLRETTLPFGYEVRPVSVRACLHLKSACTFIPPHFVVANPAWIDTAVFGNVVVMPVDDKEPLGANTLTLGQTTLVSASFPKTEKRLRNAGISTRRVEISEFEKAEGGLTCLSLVLDSRAAKLSANGIGIKTIQVSGVPPPDGHFSHAIAHNGIVYVSPQRAFDPASGRAHRQSVDEQTEHAIRNLSLVLKAAGSSLARVLRTTIYVADPKHLSRIDAVYARMFGAHRPPRAIVVNEALPAGVLFEIDAIAAVGDETP